MFTGLIQKGFFASVLITCLILLITFSGWTQNAPVTSASTVGNVTAGPVAVPVTANGFTFIGSLSLTLDYDYSVVHFVQGIKNPVLTGSFVITDNDLGTGQHRIVMSWYGAGVSLTDGSTVVTLQFNYLSGSTTLAWYDNGGSCQYTSGYYTILNDTPTGTYYINGYICGAIPDPGTISGSTSVCQGQTGLIYTVAPLANATSYSWSAPPGSLITSGNGTNSITVDYLNSSSSGVVSVFGQNTCGNGPPSNLPVTVNNLPVANAGNDTIIPNGTSTTLHAANGGNGVYSYHWSPEYLLVNPDVQNPQTVILTSTTLFTVLVTDQNSSCQKSDNKIVTITGGPLSANPLAVPSMVCMGGVSQLFSNAGGGSGSYTYMWTSIPAGNPPWSSTLANPVVTPDTTTQYLLSLNDGYTTINGSTLIVVHTLPAGIISGGDTLCGEETTVLTIDLTGAPPWNFIYSNGYTTFPINGQMTTPYLITASDSGTYTILFLEDSNCTGTTSGSAVVAHYPVPPAPVITQNGNELASSSCCGNQWYLNGLPIPGATGQTYLATVDGQYFDVATVNGCSSDTSNIIDVITGLQALSQDDLVIFPNPARDFLFICPGNKTGDIERIVIYSVEGKMILSEKESGPAGKITLDIKNIPQGFYFVMILSGTGTYSKKVIVR